MGDNKKTINDLQKKRTNLLFRIKYRIKAGKNAKDLVVEYHKIKDQLIALGVNVEIRADYLKMEYWGEKPTEISKSEPIKEIATPNQQHIYTLNLAWVDTTNSTPPQVQKVKDYFNDLCLKCNGEDITITPNGVEHILKYEFEGVEESFRLLKICTQFVLDSFAQSDFDKFNIAVFGKKRPY